MIQVFVEGHRFSVVRDFCGHGIGRRFHEPPNVLHFGRPGEGPVLKPGMFFTIEPMVNAGRPEVKVLDDGWTAVTRDRSLSAQFEHMIGVTETGCEIFTLSPAGLDKPPYKTLDRRVSRSFTIRRYRRQLTGAMGRHGQTDSTQRAYLKRSGSPDLFGATPDDPTAQGAEGHRNRMRARLLVSGPDALADHEMLEMLLFLALPRRDTKPIARELLTRFGGFGPVVTASPAELRAIEGLGDAGIAALKLAQAAALRLLRGEVAAKPVLSSWEALTDYLRAALGHEKTEQFHVLFLDMRTRLIADEVMGRGTINHAPVYPREIARRAVELHASTVMLAHNHPSGTTEASRDDIAMTREVRRALQPLGVVLHDHLIITGDGYISMLQQGLLG